MAASGVVELRSLSQPNTQFGWALIGAQVDILAVHIRHSRSTNTCPPAALAVDAYVDVVAPEKAGERFRSELGPLIGIEDLRLAEANASSERLYAEVGVEPVRQAPGKHSAGVPVWPSMNPLASGS